MTATTDTIAIYTAEGWQAEPRSLNYRRILAHAERHQLPLRTEVDVIRAAEAAYGWGAPGGPRQGQIRVDRLENWEWFRGWERAE